MKLVQNYFKILIKLQVLPISLHFYVVIFPLVPSWIRNQDPGGKRNPNVTIEKCTDDRTEEAHIFHKP